MDPTSAHDWLRPKLTALFAEAEVAGFAQDVCVAVITDLVNSAPFAASQLVADENYNQDTGEPDYMVNQNVPISAESTAVDPVANPLMQDRGLRYRRF
jgi:hypothetical protein